MRQDLIGLVSLDVRHRLIAALRQAVPARLPVVEASDKDAVGFYTANDFVTTSLSGKYLKMWCRPRTGLGGALPS
jgi:hypothetical protein